MKAFYLLAVLWEVMPCMCSHELDWVGALEPQESAPWGEIWEQLDGSQGSWSGLSASCVRQALLVSFWTRKDVASFFGRRGCHLARSGDCAGGRVGEGCLRCFVCRYFGSVDSSVEHRPIWIGAVPGLWFHFAIAASWLGQVSKRRVWSGLHKTVESQTGIFTLACATLVTAKLLVKP